MIYDDNAVIILQEWNQRNLLSMIGGTADTLSSFARMTILCMK